MKILKFFADWCAPCKMLTNTMEQMDIDIPLENIDIEQTPSVAAQYGVRGVPTVVLVDDGGTEVKRFVGYKTEKQIAEWLA